MSFKCCECQGGYSGAPSPLAGSSSHPVCDQCARNMHAAMNAAKSGSGPAGNGCQVTGSGSAAAHGLPAYLNINAGQARRTCPPNCIAVATPCDLSESALEYAAALLAPARVYELYVSQQAFPYAKMFLQRIGVIYMSNPFGPYINLNVDPAYGRDEWSIQLNGQGVWSPGV